MKQPFDFNELTALCFLTHEQMQQRAAYSVNVALVTRSWLFGCYIAEFEQKGENRAGYGKNLITNLSDALQKQGIKGASATNLKQCRSFYLSYQAISQTLSDQSLSVHSERSIFLEQASTKGTLSGCRKSGGAWLLSSAITMKLQNVYTAAILSSASSRN